MSDIFHEVDEDVRRDKAADFWRRYQTPIFVVAFLIVAATGAWSYYQDKRLKAAEAANARYVAAVALADAGNNTEAAAAFDAIAKDGSKGYATLARIRAAEARPDKAQALTELTAIGEDASVDKLTQQIALLRAALIVLEGDDLLARMLQHEIDHLDGVLLVDRLDPDSRKDALRELRMLDLPMPASGSRLGFGR